MGAIGEESKEVLGTMCQSVEMLSTSVLSFGRNAVNKKSFRCTEYSKEKQELPGFGTLSKEWRFIEISFYGTDCQRVLRRSHFCIKASFVRFFFTTDKSQSLASRRPRLDHITFHPKLGSLGDKTERVKQLMQEMAPHLGLDPTDAVRTAELSRCDLRF